MAKLKVSGERFCSTTASVITLLKKKGGGFSAINNANNAFLFDISTSSTSFHRRTIIRDVSEKDVSKNLIFTVKARKAFGKGSWLGIKGEATRSLLKSSSDDVSFETSSSKHKRPIVDVFLRGGPGDDSHPNVRVACLRQGTFQFTSSDTILAEMNMQMGKNGRIVAMDIHLRENVDYAFITSIAAIIYEIYRDIVKNAIQRLCQGIEIADEAMEIADEAMEIANTVSDISNMDT